MLDSTVRPMLSLTSVLEAQIEGSLPYPILKQVLRALRVSHPNYPTPLCRPVTSTNHLLTLSPTPAYTSNSSSKTQDHHAPLLNTKLPPTNRGPVQLSYPVSSPYTNDQQIQQLPAVASILKSPSSQLIQSPHTPHPMFNPFALHSVAPYPVARILPFEISQPPLSSPHREMHRRPSDSHTNHSNTSLGQKHIVDPRLNMEQSPKPLQLTSVSVPVPAFPVPKSNASISSVPASCLSRGHRNSHRSLQQVQDCLGHALNSPLDRLENTLSTRYQLQEDMESIPSEINVLLFDMVSAPRDSHVVWSNLREEMLTRPGLDNLVPSLDTVFKLDDTLATPGEPSVVHFSSDFWKMVCLNSK